MHLQMLYSSLRVLTPEEADVVYAHAHPAAARIRHTAVAHRAPHTQEHGCR